MNIKDLTIGYATLPHFISPTFADLFFFHFSPLSSVAYLDCCQQKDSLQHNPYSSKHTNQYVFHAFKNKPHICCRFCIGMGISMTKIRDEIKRSNDELEQKLKMSMKQELRVMLKEALPPENQRLFSPVRCVEVDYEDDYDNYDNYDKHLVQGGL